jgi:hypothetical protein
LQKANFRLAAERKFASVSRKWARLALPIAVFASMFLGTWTLGRRSNRHENTLPVLRAPELSLALQPNGRDLILQWKLALPALRKLAADIFDGDAVSHRDLTSESIKNAGTENIPHVTGNVQVVVTAIDQSGRSFVERVGFTDSNAVNRDMAASSTAAQNRLTSTATAPAGNTDAHRKKRHKRR